MKRLAGLGAALACAAFEERLLNVLQLAGLNRAYAPVFIQSFEVGNLKSSTA